MRSAALVVLLVGCADAAVHVAPVVYGSDDRDEVFEHASAPHRAIARTAIAMQISEGWLDETDPADVRITYDRTLGEAQTLCAGQAFADQLEPGTCSGTLIDGRHVLTAGHCVDAPDDCDGTSAWIFGFLYDAPGTLRTLTSNDVYRCADVVVYRDDTGGDYAVIALDRPVIGHTPAPIAGAPAALGAPLTMIGHPNGIPMKIAAGAAVVSLDGPFFSADVDAFSANSGSGVFSAGAELWGILNAGADDYVDAGGCNVVNVTDVDTTGGETLTHAGVAIAAFCATGVVSSVCGTASDAGAADARIEADAGSETDAPSETDAAAVDAGETIGEPGSCACRAGGGGGPPWILALLLAALLGRRALA